MMLPSSSKEKLPSSDRALSDSGGRDPLVAVCVMTAAVVPTSPVECAHPQWRQLAGWVADRGAGRLGEPIESSSTRCRLIGSPHSAGYGRSALNFFPHAPVAGRHTDDALTREPTNTGGTTSRDVNPHHQHRVPLLVWFFLFCFLHSLTGSHNNLCYTNSNRHYIVKKDVNEKKK
jgi:hypothetical protein